jgi:hypothetical protein
MSNTTYLAHFDATSGDFFAAALSWPTPPARLVPADWWRILRSHDKVDVALRVSAVKEPSVLLLLTADQRESLQALITTLLTTTPVAALEQPHSAVEFDSLATRAVSHQHLRVQHEGYHRDGRSLACDFRLYTAWVGQGLPDSVGYHVGLRAHPPGPEQERRVRKYLAWLDLEQPFTPPVRQLQRILSRRLLESGWLADEYLLFTNTEQRTAWQEQIGAHFLETTGRIGFSEPPLQSGDFGDWLTTGCHTARDGERPSALPVEAAYVFSDEEIAWLTGQSLVSSVAGAFDSQPEIFISYASADFTQAEATRQYLEERGRRCWIAPRDINADGLPYTEAIPLAMAKVRAVVVLLSQSANVSVHVPRELDLALERKLPIIPLRLAALAPEGQLEYLLRTCQWLDTFERDYNGAMDELDSRLGSLGL